MYQFYLIDISKEPRILMRVTAPSREKALSVISEDIKKKLYCYVFGCRTDTLCNKDHRKLVKEDDARRACGMDGEPVPHVIWSIPTPRRKEGNKA